MFRQNVRLAGASGLLWAILCISVTRGAAAQPAPLTPTNPTDPYWVSRNTPRLTTPQWVGEPGVEAVIVLAIDDMRGHEKWEAYLRPILEELKQIDGRAPVSIMTCQVDPREPHLAKWLAEGVSLECHTIDHPCPLLSKGNFTAAKSTYDRCVDQMSAVPGSRPVAFRMPCCDSQNTVSPRFFAEIFNSRTPSGKYLEIDSSVFQILTPNDSELPRDLVVAADGTERFRKYLPFRSFVNLIEDYPYPYVINRLCWEFPCVVPSDWEAQNLLKPANPRMLEDLKAALDAIVVKRGVMNVVFHPYGWIAEQQVAQFVRHAHEKYGKRVKFLTFREALARMNEHLLAGQSLRGSEGEDNGVRIMDLNADGFMDLVIGNTSLRRTRVWSPEKQTWNDSGFPVNSIAARHALFGRVNGRAVLLVATDDEREAWKFDDGGWREAPEFLAGLDAEFRTAINRHDAGARLIDLNGDGSCELIVSRPDKSQIHRWSDAGWQTAPHPLPAPATFVDAEGRDAGLRLIDIDDDLDLDALLSNEREYALDLQTSLDGEWRRVRAAERADGDELPMFVRQGTENGAWIRDGQVWIQNEDTDRLPDLVERRSFEELLAGVTPEPKSPNAALASMRPRAGMQVELVAAEPLVADPIAFDWGADGRLWVVEMADYNEAEGRPPGGRVRTLTDTDGDGRYDQSVVFMESLRYPTSVMSWKDGVLVLVPPALIFAKDTDGDGQADQREELFVGFAEGNPQHQANGLAWGLDNWIYGANGDSGGNVGPAGSEERASISGRDFRLRADRSEFEPIEGYTQFNRNRDDWGYWFGCANPNPLWQYVLNDHYLKRNPHLAAPDGRMNVSDRPGVAPVYPRSRLLDRFNDPHMANHFTSACGASIYRDELLGASYAGNSFVCEPVHNLVHREVMRQEGVEWHSRRADDEQRSEFLASTDNWFRPTTVRTGPDGAVWIADMYRQVIEHTEWIPDEFEKQVDVLAGHNLGRIYRVYPVGATPRPIPNLAKLSSAELVEQLASPNGWIRDKAQQLLLERQDKSVAPKLAEAAKSGERPTMRLHALCALEGINTIEPEQLLVALADAHPEVRRHAIRIAEPHYASSADLQSALLKLVEDPAPQVRMQVAYSLGEWADEAAGRALGRLALRDASDDWIRAAAMSSAVPHLKPMVSTIVAEARSGQGLDRLIGQLLELSAATGSDDTLMALAPAISLRGEQGFAPWQMSALAELLDLLARRNSSLVDFRQKAAPELQAAVDRLGDVFVAARQIAVDANRPEEERVTATRLLGRGLDQQAADLDSLSQLLTPEQSEAIRSATIDAIARLTDESVPGRLLAAWRSYSPSSRGRVLEALLSRPAGMAAILAALEAGKIQSGEIDTTRRQQLLTARDRELRERAKKLLAENLNADRAKVIDHYLAAGIEQGDPARGEELFNKHCSVCHRFREKGFAVGPDLSALTDKSPQALATAMLDPNRAIETKFISYTAVTADGLTHTGLLASETGNSLVLRGQEDKQQTILRSELEALESTGKSLMPEGFEKDLAPTDLAAIIAYVRANGAQPKAIAGNRPEVVKPEPLRNYFFLTPINAEIYGATLRIEEANQNLGWWTGEDDHAVWTIDVPRQMVYAVYLDMACDDASAGNEWLLECGGQRLTGRVEGTGDWNVYRRVKVGELNLKAGQHRLGLRASGPIQGAMLDLKGVVLIPFGRFQK